MNDDVSLELKFGDLCHDTLAETMPHELSFDENKDYDTWRKQDGYRRIRFVFESEKDAFVPCY